MDLPSPDKMVFIFAVFGLVSTICLLVLAWIQRTEIAYWHHLYDKSLDNVNYWSRRNRTYRDFLIDKKMWREFEEYSELPAIELLPPIPDYANDNERKEPTAPVWARIRVPPIEDASVVDKEIPEPAKA